MKRESEPPSCSLAPSVFLIGRNGRGNWIAQDRFGRCGGLFVDRAHALRFALFENGNHPDAIVMVSDAFELDMGDTGAAALAQNNSGVLHRRAA